MGPLLVLVSPCLRENVVVTSKIGSFLCSLDNLLQKNVTVFFFENQISKWRSFEKRAIFDLLFTFFSYQEKVTNIPSYLTHIHTCILLTLLSFFCLTNFEKIRIYQVWFLFGMSPGVDSYLRHFETINKYQNGEQNLSWNVYYKIICIYTNAKFIVICKPRTLNDGSETQFSTKIAKSTTS